MSSTQNVSKISKASNKFLLNIYILSSHKPFKKEGVVTVIVVGAWGSACCANIIEDSVWVSLWEDVKTEAEAASETCRMRM